MPKPWEITEEEARREGEELRERLLKADRIAAPRLAKQLAELVEAEAASPNEQRSSPSRRYPRFSISQSLAPVERAQSGGPAVGGSDLTLALKSELFSYWIGRDEKEAFLLVERAPLPQNRIDFVEVKNTSGRLVASCDAGALDRYGRAKLVIGSVMSGQTIVLEIEAKSPLGEEQFELEILWQ